jgi:hypothetical protein
MNDLLSAARLFLAVSIICGLESARATPASRAPEEGGRSVLATRLACAATDVHARALAAALRGASILWGLPRALRDDDLRSLAWKNLYDLVNFETVLSELTGTFAGISRHAWLHRFALAIRALHSTLLEWRLDGARELGELVSAAEKHTPPRGGSAAVADGDKFTTPRLLRLVVATGVLFPTIGERLHVEVLRRMDRIVELLVREGEWTQDLTARLWSAALVRHSAERAALLHTLGVVLEAEADAAVDDAESIASAVPEEVGEGLPTPLAALPVAHLAHLATHAPRHSIAAAADSA